MPAPGPDRGSGTIDRPAALISLETLFLDKAGDPCPVPHASSLLTRLAEISQPVILVGERLADHRLPAAWPDRRAWLHHTLGGEAYTTASFEAPPAARLNDDAALSDAAACWAEVAARHGARWLLSSDPHVVRPAQAAGLAVVAVGPRVAAPEVAAVVRPDREARDLRDAVNQLLLEAIFAG